MKTYLITVALLISLSAGLFSQSISEVNFLKLFEYANSDQAVTKINEGLTYISPNWKLLGDIPKSNTYSLEWGYKPGFSYLTTAQFYLTSTKTENSHFVNSVRYDFLSLELFQRYISSVAGLDGCEVVYSKLERNGERKTIYQNAYTAFTFRVIPVNLYVDGNPVKKKYSVEMHAIVN